MHVFPGYQYIDGMEEFWDREYVTRFLEVLRPHMANHILTVGGHTHRFNVFAMDPASNHVMVVSPAVTPITKLNNPGYTVITLDEDSYRVEDVEYTFFVL